MSEKVVLSLPDEVRWRLKSAAARRRMTMSASLLAGFFALRAGRWRETRPPAKQGRGTGRATFLMSAGQRAQWVDFAEKKGVTQRELAERILQILEATGPLELGARRAAAAGSGAALAEAGAAQAAE